MLSFTPSQEQTMLVDGIQQFGLNELRPAAHAADESRQLPGDLVRKGWGFGLFGAAVPEKYGGLGEYSALTNVLAAEAFAWGDLSVALAAFAPALVGLPALLSATEEQQQSLLPQLTEAEPPPYTAALLEPGISFDVQALRTTATRQAERYALNGAKCCVPLAAESRLVLVYARDSETGQHDGYLVDVGTDGLTITSREQLMGIRALPTYGLSLTNVQVDASCKLGGSPGSRYDRIVSHSRVALAAMAVGVGRAAFEYARDYAKTRIQFGVPIATKQAIAFMLAEVAIDIDAARLLAWEPAWQLDQDAQADLTASSCLAKEYADKAVLYAADCAVQILGGHGYIREHPVEGWLRNARGFTSFDGLAMI